MRNTHNLSLVTFKPDRYQLDLYGPGRGLSPAGNEELWLSLDEAAKNIIKYGNAKGRQEQPRNKP